MVEQLIQCVSTMMTRNALPCSKIFHSNHKNT